MDQYQEAVVKPVQRTKKRKSSRAFVLALVFGLGLLVWANMNRPDIATSNSVTTGDWGTTGNYGDNIGKDNNYSDNKPYETRVCVVSATISTAALPVNITLNDGYPGIYWRWNLTGATDNTGCYKWEGSSGVVYDFQVFYLYPSFGNVSTSMDVPAGSNSILDLDKACC